jgi:hypothetical protein
MAFVTHVRHIILLLYFITCIFIFILYSLLHYSIMTLTCSGVSVLLLFNYYIGKF